jgi:peptidyl-prolyl cis-trans isomerase B (cyclophilin B)
VAKSKQRERQLARARWERQRARRAARAARARRIGIAVGVLAAVVAGTALVWLILHIGKTEDDRKNQQLTPTSSAPTSAASSATQSGSGSAGSSVPTSASPAPRTPASSQGKP